MVSLFDGAFDYRKFLADLVLEPRLEASLEWFGGDVQKVLSRDREALSQLEAEARHPNERPRAPALERRRTLTG
jgi:3-dehydroshikimate dehydratase